VGDRGWWGVCSWMVMQNVCRTAVLSSVRQTGVPQWAACVTLREGVTLRGRAMAAAEQWAMNPTRTVFIASVGSGVKGQGPKGGQSVKGPAWGPVRKP